MAVLSPHWPALSSSHHPSAHFLDFSYCKIHDSACAWEQKQFHKDKVRQDEWTSLFFVWPRYVPASLHANVIRVHGFTSVTIVTNNFPRGFVLFYLRTSNSIRGFDRPSARRSVGLLVRQSVGPSHSSCHAWVENAKNAYLGCCSWYRLCVNVLEGS